MFPVFNLSTEVFAADRKHSLPETLIALLWTEIEETILICDPVEARQFRELTEEFPFSRIAGQRIGKYGKPWKIFVLNNLCY